jgi:hypothetical protein
MNELSIGITLNPDEDCVRLQFDNIGDELAQQGLAQYLHPRLSSIKQQVPQMNIQVRVTDSTELIVDFEPVGDWTKRQQFEKFLYNWLPTAMKDYD